MVKTARDAPGGFTLIEVMLSLTVLAILIILATPSFHEVLLAQAVKNASFDVFSDLLLARSEAITRNSTVSVVPRAGNWSEGWTVADFSGELVKRQDRLPRVTITGPGRVTYNSAGRVTVGGTSIDLVANGGRATHASCISIDLSGRPVQKQERCY